MSNIYFMCENCGIETNGIRLVNGMKFCAKCYHQIFGKDNQQIEINQLKQELAEKDKEIEMLKNTINLYNLRHKGSVLPNVKQLAIQQLEKVKEDCFNQKELVDFGNVACFMVDIVDILEIINNQIKELKGEKDEKGI